MKQSEKENHLKSFCESRGISYKDLTDCEKKNMYNTTNFQVYVFAESAEKRGAIVREDIETLSWPESKD